MNAIDALISQYLDPESNETDRALIDLLEEGFVECALDGDTGELMFSMTETGKKLINQLCPED